MKIGIPCCDSICIYIVPFTKAMSFIASFNSVLGFCKALKRPDDKVVMVYSVEVFDSMYCNQWYNGMYAYIKAELVHVISYINRTRVPPTVQNTPVKSLKKL